MGRSRYPLCIHPLDPARAPASQVIVAGRDVVFRNGNSGTFRLHGIARKRIITALKKSLKTSLGTVSVRRLIELAGTGSDGFELLEMQRKDAICLLFDVTGRICIDSGVVGDHDDTICLAALPDLEVVDWSKHTFRELKNNYNLPLSLSVRRCHGGRTRSGLDAAASLVFKMNCFGQDGIFTLDRLQLRRLADTIDTLAPEHGETIEHDRTDRITFEPLDGTWCRTSFVASTSLDRFTGTQLLRLSHLKQLSATLRAWEGDGRDNREAHVHI